MKQSDIEREAISLIKNEKTQWEDAVAFVTEKVAFNMRNLVRQCRKNWWGVFDQPIDPTTGRKKIWVPLTESIGETAIKNVDLDTKDITFRAKHPGAIRMTGVIRSIVRNYLDKMGFGEKLDEFEVTLARDGTAVWQTEDIDKECKVSLVDLLNVYIDPTSPSIQEAYRFTVKALLYPDEIKKMKGWINTDVEVVEGLPRNDTFTTGNSNVKMADVWTSYGKYPKFLLTGKKEDKDIEIDIKIIVSGLETPGKEKVHLIESYNGFKPFEEAWYSRVPGRWYGKGVAEKLMMLQSWINTIVNIRINRSYVSQLGIFKIRKGSGITPQMLSKLPANGAVTVNSIDDIEQFVMQEASQSSYSDEQNAQSWAQRVTSAYETVTGERLPAETSATATAIQSRSATSQFVLIKEQIGMFLQRWLKRHSIPIMMKHLTQGELVRMMQEPDDMMKWDEDLINQTLYEQLDAIEQRGLFIDPMQVEMERQRALAQMQHMGTDRFAELDIVPDFLEYDVAIDITNESVDKGVISQNLITALQAAPEYKDQILQQLFDQMGLTFKPMQNPMMAQQPGQPPAASPKTQDPNQALGKANVLANQSQYGP